jgi:type I restriction enzyme S subunit
LTENACKLVLKPDVSNRFIFYFTRTSSFADQALANTRIAAQPKLALSRLKTVSLGVPALKEQLRLVSMLDEMATETRRLADAYSKKISGLATLKQSILQKAFAGELASPSSHAIKEAAE